MTIIPPGSTIGILGGGQLGRMTALAAAKLGYKTHIYAAAPDEPACLVTPFHTLGNFDDKKKLAIFAGMVDVVTLEWENVPVDALTHIAQLKPLRPKADVLKITQDRVLEKTFARGCGVATPDFRAVTTLDELKNAVMQIGIPAVLKSARFGYDGKGQAVIKDLRDIESAWQAINSTHAILEAFVPFEKEISVIIARQDNGASIVYPPAENRHKNGILDETQLPARISSGVAEKATALAKTLADKLNVVGLLAVEMFVTGDNVLMNEMAPRPHNSGHWSMDFCATSQFEQLVRAICGLPLGATTITHPCLMKNLIGDDVKDWKNYVNAPDTYLHLYGKTDARPGRKMGHVNEKR